MGLEKTFSVEKEKTGFYVATSAYILAGLVDGFLTVKGLNMGLSDFNPLAQFFVNNYGVESGVALIKANGLVAIMASEIIERRATSNSRKNLMHNLLYAGTALSGLGILGWINS